MGFDEVQGERSRNIWGAYSVILSDPLSAECSGHTRLLRMEEAEVSLGNCVGTHRALGSVACSLPKARLGI
jgi:hypothetical protein